MEMLVGAALVLEHGRTPKEIDNGTSHGEKLLFLAGRQIPGPQIKGPPEGMQPVRVVPAGRVDKGRGQGRLARYELVQQRQQVDCELSQAGQLAKLIPHGAGFVLEH